jgi:heme A synthase
MRKFIIEWALVGLRGTTLISFLGSLFLWIEMENRALAIALVFSFIFYSYCIIANQRKRIVKYVCGTFLLLLYIAILILAFSAALPGIETHNDAPDL